MKRIIAFLTVAIFLLTAGIAFGEQATEQATTAEKAPTKYLSIKGEVTAVDPATQSLTIKSKKQEVQLTVTDKTKIMIDKEKKSLADVKVGDTVKARYKKEKDRNVATSINVIPKKAEAAPMK